MTKRQQAGTGDPEGEGGDGGAKEGRSLLEVAEFSSTWLGCCLAE